MGAQEPLLPGSFVGRREETATAVRLLGDGVRLVTLTGPPGVGKTRLATEVAGVVAADYSDGTFLVDLSSARDAVTALNEVAGELGLFRASAARPRHALHEWLRERRALIVLDNAEQVSGLADEVPDLLAQGRRCSIVVTSRENLRLTMEHELSVPPLAMPALADAADLDRLMTSAAVQMFAAEARAVDATFAVTADNAAAVADICIRLDGLPLALKLAAARVKLFSPADIADRIRDRSAFLDANQRDILPRHRSLRAAISWSYQLLTPAEKALFRRLSVFATPWTLDSATLVDAGEVTRSGRSDDVVDLVSSLLDKSLVRRVGDDRPTRFAMLESLREYAAEELDRAGERSDVARRHLSHFVATADASEAVIGTEHEGTWWDAMGRYERDVCAALDWAEATDDTAACASLAAALSWFRYLRGQVGAGAEVVDSVMDRVRADPSGLPDTAVSLYVVAGVLAWAGGSLDSADHLLTEAVGLAQAHDDARHEAMATAFLGQVARDGGRLDDARAYHRSAQVLFERLGNRRGAAWSRYDQGRTCWQSGELTEAVVLLTDALATFRELDYEWAAAWTAWALGSVRLSLGERADGAAQVLSAIDGFEAVSDPRGVAGCLESLAIAAAEDARLAQTAVRLLSAAAATRQRLAAPPTDRDRAAARAAEQAAVAHVGESAARSARESGRTMGWPAVLALAHRVGTELGSGGDVPEVVLTSREREVAALVAAGCTNQQIGRSLGITDRTAEAHLRNIMVKLDARSRSEVAVWTVTNGVGTGR